MRHVVRRLATSLASFERNAARHVASSSNTQPGAGTAAQACTQTCIWCKTGWLQTLHCDVLTLQWFWFPQ